jgi:hypothetical protein
MPHQKDILGTIRTPQAIPSGIAAKKQRKAHWADFRKFESISPVGYNKENQEARFYGYFPICGFYTGAVELYDATNMLYKSIVLGQYTVYKEKEIKNEQGKTLIRKRLTQVLEFTPAQRVALAVLQFGNYVRGLVTFLQLGVVFAPFDLAANVIGKRLIIRV